MEKGVKFLKPKDFKFEDDLLDTYIEIKAIRKGDVIYECERGENHKLKALTNARRISDGFYVVMETILGEKVELFYSEYTDYPGPRLFLVPQHLTEMNKQLVYLLD